MKKRIISQLITLFSGISLLVSAPLFSQHLRKIENTAFNPGEKITYRVFYDSYLTGNVVAGEASLEIKSGLEVIGGRKTMAVVGLGRSRGAFNYFFRVVNRYETYIDEDAIAPHMFMRRVSEGSFKLNQNVLFNHYENIAISNTATVKTVPYVQDIISAFYFLRTYSFENLKAGDAFQVQFFLDDEVYTTQVIFEGREEISTRMGTFKTLRFKPEVLTGNVFSQPYPMTIWISDDKNKIPILAQSGIIVGSVKMELTQAKGLRNAFTSKIR